MYGKWSSSLATRFGTWQTAPAARYHDLLPVMANQALGSGSPANNPRTPTSDEIIELYRRVYG